MGRRETWPCGPFRLTTYGREPCPRNGLSRDKPGRCWSLYRRKYATDDWGLLANTNISWNLGTRSTGIRGDLDIKLSRSDSADRYRSPFGIRKWWRVSWRFFSQNIQGKKKRWSQTRRTSQTSRWTSWTRLFNLQIPERHQILTECLQLSSGLLRRNASGNWSRTSVWGYTRYQLFRPASLCTMRCYKDSWTIKNQRWGKRTWVLLQELRDKRTSLSSRGNKVKKWRSWQRGHVKDSVNEAAEVLSGIFNTHKCFLESGVEIQKRLEFYPASKRMGIYRRPRSASLEDTPKKTTKGEGGEDPPRG